MNAATEIEAKQRFQFGANWSAFLSAIDEERILAAESALKEMLAVERLEGQGFLDIGSGSGLSSLAARRLGAKVHSFDFDQQSVACTRELKRRYFPDDDSWRIAEGSVLDKSYLESLGKFDIVYSWGVLHHTGAMWLAIENALHCVSTPEGKLLIAIYNGQGWKSHLWWFIKYFYNRLPRLLKAPFVASVMTVTHILLLAKYTIKLEPMTAVRALSKEKSVRGMSARYDKIDWVGGFPYEFAEYETLLKYLEARGFCAVKTRRNTSLGCSEFSVKRVTSKV